MNLFLIFIVHQSRTSICKRPRVYLMICVFLSHQRIVFFARNVQKLLTFCYVAYYILNIIHITKLDWNKFLSGTRRTTNYWQCFCYFINVHIYFVILLVDEYFIKKCIFSWLERDRLRNSCSLMRRNYIVKYCQLKIKI